MSTLSHIEQTLSDIRFNVERGKSFNAEVSAQQVAAIDMQIDICHKLISSLNESRRQVVDNQLENDRVMNRIVGNGSDHETIEHKPAKKKSEPAIEGPAA